VVAFTPDSTDLNTVVSVSADFVVKTVIVSFTSVSTNSTTVVSFSTDIFA